MKTESLAKFVMRLALTLLIITSVVAVCLAGVNKITAPAIAQQNLQKTQQAITAVLPGGYDTEVTSYADDTGLVSKVYAGANGYAFEVNPVGFDSAITMMVGVGNDGKVLGISIVSHSETSGLGAVAAAQTATGESFRQQFVGASGSVSVSKDGGSIDALTGATITSRAVCTGINAALACAANLG